MIFHLTARFKADTHPKKLNLGVGAYRDEALKPYVFSAVRKAEAAVVAAGNDKEYLPIAGLPELRVSSSCCTASPASLISHAHCLTLPLHVLVLVQTLSANLLFGAESPALKEKRVTSVQTLSGTGSLTVAAHLIKRVLAGRRLFCSEPTWENHGKVVTDAGAGVLEYHRYYNPATCGLDLDGMLADLKAVPAGSIILLHACAHNPTGVDPTREQWAAIADVMQERKLFPWFDCAYQGFASGSPDEDAWAVRYFVERGFEMLVCQSFAKNFGLYCERVGALHVVAADAASANAVLTNIESIVRPMYSNPPAHGARIVATVLGSADLAAEWRAELLAAMSRVKRMRGLLEAALGERGTPGSWSHITKQIGMFSYTGLSKEQSERMVEEFHVYMLNSGRINVAGLNEASIPICADAIHAVVTGAAAPK